MGNETKNENEKEDLKGKETEAQETEVVEVAIVESDAEPEEAPAAESEPPPVVETERVAEILLESDLSTQAHAWILRQDYQDEGGVGRAIDEMRTFIADMTPAGQVFALGETAAVDDSGVPKLRTDEELKARARENTRTIMNELDPTYAVNL